MAEQADDGGNEMHQQEATADVEEPAADFDQKQEEQQLAVEEAEELDVVEPVRARRDRIKGYG